MVAPSDYSSVTTDTVVPSTTHPPFSYNNVFTDIITDTFEIQKAADIVVNSVIIQLKQTGITIDFDPSFFIQSVKKMTDILIIHKLILGLGLGSYQQEIMNHFIADRFGRKDIPASVHHQGIVNERIHNSSRDSVDMLRNDMQDFGSSQISMENVKSVISKLTESGLSSGKIK